MRGEGSEKVHMDSYLLNWFDTSCIGLGKWI